MGVFPTHVGMNRTFSLYYLYYTRVPHARGDEPLRDRRLAYELGCSPRTWG